MKSKRVFFQFLCLLILPSISFPYLKNFIDSENHENREYAQKPLLTADTLLTFPQQFETYFTDYLPYKNQLVMLNTMKEKMLGVGTTFLEYRTISPVICGTEDWLFYNSLRDGEHSFDDYMCNNLYEEEKLKEIADGYVKLYQELQKRGSELLVVYAANKEQIYSEYMPKVIQPEGTYSRMDQLTAYLQENTDVPVLYTKEALQKEKDNYPLFYKYDTHWNQLGGYIGAQLINAYFHGESVALDEVSCQITEEKPVADLADMLGMGAVYQDDVTWKVENYKPEIEAQLLEHDTQAERFEFLSNAEDKREVFVLMDSFGYALMDTLIKDFQKVTFLRNYNDEKSLAEFKKYYEKEQPKIVVLEILERRSSWQENLPEILYRTLVND